MTCVIVLPPKDSPMVIGMGCGKRNADSKGQDRKEGLIMLVDVYRGEFGVGQPEDGVKKW
jgi:hypothetical protein